MSRTTHALLALGLAGVAALPAHAADGPDLQQIQQEIRQLKASYEARIQALEKKLADVQQAPTAAAVAAPATPVEAPAAAAFAATPEPARAAPSAGGIGAFNPAISLILNGTYASLSRNPDLYKLQGFIPSGGEAGPGSRGFQLGESELSLGASIDPTFSGHLTFSLTGDDKVSVEEAVFERQGLASGLSLKGGRFLSGFGYLNSQHAHAWDFVDAPLVYQAFFGGQSKTDGLQLRWLAPTDRFFEVGAELGSGRTFPGSDTGRNSAGSASLYAHLGDDIGDDASYRLGLSYLHYNATDRSYTDSNAAGSALLTHSFTGDSNIWALDGIYKWAPGGNGTRTNFKLQGEYFRRAESGSLAYDTLGVNQSNGYNSTQSGWYLQAVYQFMPQWRVGARYDKLDSGTPTLGRVAAGLGNAGDFPILQSASPSRGTLMLDYSPSEFSRFRLQFANDLSNPAGNDRQIFLQYIMSLGAHGAHAF